MVLFANEPPAYRLTMARAVAERTGLEAATLPEDRPVEEGIAWAGASVVVTSTTEPAAIRLSDRAVVVNLMHEPQERAVVYRDGTRIREEALDGLVGLATLLEDLAPAGRRA